MIQRAKNQIKDFFYAILIAPILEAVLKGLVQAFHRQESTSPPGNTTQATKPSEGASEVAPRPASEPSTKAASSPNPTKPSESFWDNPENDINAWAHDVIGLQMAKNAGGLENLASSFSPSDLAKLLRQVDVTRDAQLAAENIRQERLRASLQKNAGEATPAAAYLEKIATRAAAYRAELKAAEPLTYRERVAARAATYHADCKAKETAIIESNPAYLKALTAIRAIYEADETNPSATPRERLQARASRYGAERKALDAFPEVKAKLEALAENPNVTPAELLECTRPTFRGRSQSFGRDI